MALPRIKYPVGIQTFPEIIKEKYFYEDKTGLIYELVNTSKYVFLSRPRRFGKSLLMSTIEAYFRGEQTLFQGLEIEKMEEKYASIVDISRLFPNLLGRLRNTYFEVLTNS